MPRDGSNIYHRPVGTDGVPNYPIESTKYNASVADVEQDLNLPRPVVAGGTGATNATDALFNLKAETATQIVTNWDTQIWVPGSFYAAASAIGAAPVPGHAFAGQCYIGEPLANPPTNQNIILEARDLDSPIQPGPISARQMKAGVWSPWSTTSTAGDQASFRQSIYAAPFDAMAYNGMQVNGSMEISQENGATAVLAVPGGVGRYVVDGWAINLSGTTTGQVFGQQHTMLPDGGLSNSFNCRAGTPAPSTGATDFVLMQQSIEGTRWRRLGWGTPNAEPVTIAFWIYTNTAGTYAVALRNAPSATRSYVTTVTTVAGTWKYVTITVPGDGAAGGGAWSVTNGIGVIISICAQCSSASLMTATQNAWVAGNYVAVTGQQSNALTNTNLGIYLSGFVILPGNEAPSSARLPLIMRPYDQELVTCKRYWSCTNPSAPNGSSVGAITMLALSSTVAAGNVAFPAEMRAIPTITMWVNGTQNIARVTINAGLVTVPSPTIAGITRKSATTVIAGSGAPFTTNTMYDFDLICDARL